MSTTFFYFPDFVNGNFKFSVLLINLAAVNARTQTNTLYMFPVHSPFNLISILEHCLGKE